MRALQLTRSVEGLTLQAAVQLAGFADSGGAAKRLIQGGEILLNGAVELRRSHLVHIGDLVAYEGDEVELIADDH